MFIVDGAYDHNRIFEDPFHPPYQSIGKASWKGWHKLSTNIHTYELCAWFAEVNTWQAGRSADKQNNGLQHTHVTNPPPPEEYSLSKSCVFNSLKYKCMWTISSETCGSAWILNAGKTEYGRTIYCWLLKQYIMWLFHQTRAELCVTDTQTPTYTASVLV